MQELIAAVLGSLGDDLSRWEERVFETVCGLAQGACAGAFEDLDDELAALRDKDLRVVGRRKRTVVTKFGSFTLRRRLYRETSGKGRYLLDEALGLRSRTQATPALEGIVLTLASDRPFREAASVLEQTSGGVLSHQMIHRILQRTGALIDSQEQSATETLTETGELPPSKNREADRLFVEADGTVISLQRSQRKKAEVKQVIAYEGWDRVGKKEWKTRNKTVLCGLGPSSETWDRFTHHLLCTYRPGVLSSLVIGGDGASWVRAGAHTFQGSLYQLDRFHLKRALLRASGNFRAAGRAYRAATSGDIASSLRLLEAHTTEEERAQVAGYLKENTSGLLDYRDRLGLSEQKDLRGLGAIESNIDKNLANRMKKRGMAWSKRGAHHMAKVIQLRINGEPFPTGRIDAPPEVRKRIAEALGRARQALPEDPGSWLAVRMPALTGPHQARPWVKMLRSLSEAGSLEGNQKFAY